MLGTSENLALAQGFLKFRHYSREQERAMYICQGENMALRYFKGSQCGHFSFTRWKELLKTE